MPVQTFTTLNDPLATNSTQAFGINAAGTIVGNYQASAVSIDGFLYSGGTYTTLADPVATFTQALGINNAGQIVGVYAAGIGNTPHGFLLSGGTYTTIDDPSATNITEAFGINDRGQIVGLYMNASGLHGFLLSGGVYTTLDDSAGAQASGTAALGITHAAPV